MVDYHIYAIVLAAVALDFLSGIAKAAKAGGIASKAMREGLMHKAAYIFVLSAAVLVEHCIGYLDIGFAAPITAPVAAGIVLIEITSVIENVGEINPALKGSALLALFKVSSKEEQ